MSPLAIVFLIIGIVLVLTGAVICIVAAFRVSILWGLAYLFVPFAKLFFYIFHWQEAKTGFFLGLCGGLFLIGTIAADPGTRNEFTKGMHLPASTQESKKEPDDIATRLQDSRERLITLQEEYTQVNADVTTQYQALSAASKKLKTTDQQAVHQFNQQAAAYQSQNARLKQLTADIATTNKTVSDLLDERSKLQNSQGVAGNTSSTAPAR